MTLTVETLAAILRKWDEDDADVLAAWLLPQLGAGAPAPVVKIAPGVPPEDEAGHTLDDHIGALETLAAPGHRETARQLADSALRLYAVLLRAARVGATERVERSADASEGPWRPTGEETHERT